MGITSKKMRLDLSLYIDLLISKLISIYYSEFLQDKNREFLRHWVRKTCGSKWQKWEEIRDEVDKDDLSQQFYLIYTYYKDNNTKEFIVRTMKYMNWLINNIGKRHIGEEGFAELSLPTITEYQTLPDTITLKPDNYIAFLATKGYSVRNIEDITLISKSEVHRQLQDIEREGVSIRNVKGS